MKLSGPEIIRQRDLGAIVIEPFDASQANPNSYNIRLGPILLYLDELTLDLHRQPREVRIDMREHGGQFTLRKGWVYLGSTIERIGSKQFVPIIDGRSTTGRYGLATHITAGFCDLGFLGHITLELEARHRDIVVRPGDMIAQVSFETVLGAVQLYSGSYQDQTEPRGPKPLRPLAPAVQLEPIP